ncbi:MAG: CPBP family intramembrane metalloprotease [Planctomycetaceae bacterium]|nr:CPBP family intramembrane metalloprotease [Planctomycetaceae bacterium]
MSGYLNATRHPWSCFLFLVPLLAVYEGGVLWFGGDQADRMRNGADAWLRWGLERFGAGQVLAAPAVVITVMLIWSWWRWADRPTDLVTTIFGMAFESCIFAVGLWQFSRNFGPILDGLGVHLQISTQATPMAKILTFIGAGIYEEVLFRLALFSGLLATLRVLQIPNVPALLLATAAAALAFAAAHHIGPYGEPMRADYFVFRTSAGLYFTLLFVFRGFGIAVGAHAGYDVLVGVSVG